MEPTDQLEQIIPTLNATVRRIQVMQMNDPTPCSKFTVQDVLDHMMVLGGTFAYWFRGEEAPELKAPSIYGVVPAAKFREVMDDLLDAVKSPGAMDRTIASPMGEMSGSTFARLVAFDAVVHGWDLASSTGVEFEVPADVIDAVDTFARTALTPDMRDGKFNDATTAPDGSSRLESLAAFSGRSV